MNSHREDSPKILFILGSGHCGSTLLDMLLDKHEGFLGLGELVALDYEDDPGPLGEKVKELSWLEHFDIYRKKFDYLYGKGKFYTAKTHEPIDLKEYIVAHEHIYMELAKDENCSFIVDSSKNPDRAESLSWSKNIDPYIIHLVRDGRGVTWSYLKKYPHNKFYALTVWFISNIKIELLKRRICASSFYISYDLLVENPEKALTLVFSRLGVKRNPLPPNTPSGLGHQIGGNRMKHTFDGVVTKDTEWKENMPFRYKLLFNVLFGWLNIFYKWKHKRISYET